MNEIAVIQRAHRQSEISNVAWIRSEQNIGDSLIRHNHNGILHKAMETGRLDFTKKQWIYKDNGHSN